MDEIRKIKKIVKKYVTKYHTNDPFEIADGLGIFYQIGNIGIDGCYMYIKKHRYIFLNKNLSDTMLKLVMAHELGHAIFDRKENCYFIRNKTLLLNSKSERRANRFAAYLLISEDFLQEYAGYTKEQFSLFIGYPKELIDLRFEFEHNNIQENFDNIP